MAKGHYYPAMAVGKILAEQGFEVIFITHSNGLRKDIERFGMTSVLIGWGRYPDTFIEETFLELREVFIKTAADLIITDSTFAASAMAAEFLHIPWISFQTSLPLKESVVQRFVSRIQRNYINKVNKLRAKYSLSALDPSWMTGDYASLSSLLHLVMVYPELIEEGTQLPSGSIITGPCGMGDVQQYEDTVALYRRLHILICTSSAIRTDYKEVIWQYVNASVKGLASMEGTVIVDRPNQLRLSWPSFRNTEWTEDGLNHDSLLPHADVAITHAGCGTLQRCLKYGVPMVIIPLGEEQFDTAYRFMDLGLAVVLEPDDVNPTNIRSALLQCINDGRIAANVREMSIRYAMLKSEQMAVDAIEQWMRGENEYADERNGNWYRKTSNWSGTSANEYGICISGN